MTRERRSAYCIGAALCSAIALAIAPAKPGAASGQGGAAYTPGTVAPDTFVRAEIITDPAPARFSVCHAHGCTLVSQVGFSEEQWSGIAAILAAPAVDPAGERELIAQAIAAFEKTVGPMTGTDQDKGGNASAPRWEGRMDCIDESTNTTTYLRMLARAGLLKWHAVEARSTRGFFIFGWPHTTAVIRDVREGARWAVDSFYFDNGYPPVIVPLELWKTGWRPAKPPAAPSP